MCVCVLRIMRVRSGVMWCSVMLCCGVCVYYVMWFGMVCDVNMVYCIVVWFVVCSDRM